MRIGIDARFWGIKSRGLGRYTQKLVENLEKLDDKNEYFVFLRRENFSEFESKNPNFHKVLADYYWYGFGEQLFFPFLLLKNRLDLMHFPHFNVPLLYPKKYILTIHDLILLRFPTLKATTLNPLFYWFKFAAYLLAIALGSLRASKIIAVSEFTKNDILKHFPWVRTKKVVVTYEGVEKKLSPENSRGNDYVPEGKFLLYVGNAYPHKNLPKLIEAFRLLKKTNFELKLILVGGDDYFWQRIKDDAKRQEIEGVEILNWVDDSQLEKLYEKASVFVFPSLFEGFGLPPLEAMRAKTPVVSSDAACMREILGEGALFADGKNAQDLADKINLVLDDQQLRADLINKGLRRAEKYNWEKMAKETLAQYQLLA